jgi:ABC-type polysaccharide/polyol phosphate export permease
MIEVKSRSTEQCMGGGSRAERGAQEASVWGRKGGLNSSAALCAPVAVRRYESEARQSSNVTDTGRTLLIKHSQNSWKNMVKNPTAIALADIAAAVRRYSLVGMLGWQDVRQRYRRSALGPLWLTISMGVMIGTIGIVFGSILKTPLKEFMPFLSAGIILWGFISNVLTESCSGFIAAEGVIKQLPIPLFVHIMRMMWRNVLIFAHNLLIFPIVLVIIGGPVSFAMLLSVVGFIVLLANLFWVALLLALVCARYRDLAQIVTSSLQVIFYLTPIVWLPKALPHRVARYVLDFNPVYHLLEIVRAPLIGELPSMVHWVFACCLSIIGWTLTLAVYGRYKRRVAYWL